MDIYELSKLESLVFNMGKYGDCIVSATAFLSNDQSKEIDKELIKKCLNLLQERHPFMRAHYEYNKKSTLRIENEDNIYKQKVELEWLELDGENTNKSDISKNIEIFSSRMFTYKNKSLIWRYQVIRSRKGSTVNYTMTLVMPSIICDGICIMAVLIESINILNSLLSNKECPEMNEKLSLIGNLHSLCEANNLVGEKQLEAIKTMGNNKPKKLLLPSKFKSNVEYGTKINFLKFNKVKTGKLIAILKSKQIKVTGFLNAAIIYALRDLYIENGLDFPIELSCSFAANMRIRYRPKLDFFLLSNQVCPGAFETEAKYSSKYKDIWADSVYINNLISTNTDMESGRLFQFTHNMKILDAGEMLTRMIPFDFIIKKLFSFVKSTDLIVSNVGNYINEVRTIDGPLKIDEIYFGDSMSSKPNMFPAVGLFICNWKDELMFRIGSNKSAFSSIYADRLTELFEKFLIDIIDKSN